MYLNIKNINKNGVFDYKGLDIYLFVAGSQAYASDYNSCVLSTTQENFALGVDIVTMTEAEYLLAKNQIDEANRIPLPPQPPSDLEILQEGLAEQNQMLSDFMDYIYLSIPDLP